MEGRKTDGRMHAWLRAWMEGRWVVEGSLGGKREATKGERRTEERKERRNEGGWKGAHGRMGGYTGGWTRARADQEPGGLPNVDPARAASPL